MKVLNANLNAQCFDLQKMAKNKDFLGILGIRSPSRACFIA